MRFRFIEEHRDSFPAKRLCHVVGVSTRGLRAFRTRPASRRQRSDMVTLVPGHPIHVIFLLFHHGVGAPTSHTGFEKLKIGKVAGVEVGDFFHQLHHRFFDCNYGTYETPWDTWLGTFHDGSTEGNEIVKERRRKIWSTK